MGEHLEGKSVIITGGGRGIGRAIALAAAGEGAGVVIADYGGDVSSNSAGTSEAADAVVKEIEAAGGRAVAAPVDVSTMQGGRDAAQAAVDTFGRLDGLVCCAGITNLKYLWELEEQEWDDVIGVHLKGHFSCVQAAAKVMIPQRSGSIVTIASGSWTGMPNTIAYSTAKAGILGFTWSTAYGLGRFGIRANCMVPSAATRMSDTIYGTTGKLSNRFGDTMRSDMAEGTYRDPSQVAPLAVHLLSDASSEVNGQVLRAQGYEISRMMPMTFAFNRTITSVGPWDVDAIAERLPVELGPDLQPPPVPWPEPDQVPEPTA